MEPTAPEAVDKGQGASLLVSYWKSLTGERSFFASVSSRKALQRFPWCTVACATTCFAIFYLIDDTQKEELVYRRSESASYTAFTFTFCHASSEHLWTNELLLVVGGSLLEFTDGWLLIATLFAAAGPIACGMHSLFRDTGLRGASGVCYAILYSQISILLLNWRQLSRPERCTRLAVLLLLLSVSAVDYATG